MLMSIKAFSDLNDISTSEIARPTNTKAIGQRISINKPLISLIVIKNLLFIDILKSLQNLDFIL